MGCTLTIPVLYRYGINAVLPQQLHEHVTELPQPGLGASFEQANEQPRVEVINRQVLQARIATSTTVK